MPPKKVSSSVRLPKDVQADFGDYLDAIQSKGFSWPICRVITAGLLAFWDSPARQQHVLMGRARDYGPEHQRRQTTNEGWAEMADQLLDEMPGAVQQDGKGKARGGKRAG